MVEGAGLGCLSKWGFDQGIENGFVLVFFMNNRINEKKTFEYGVLTVFDWFEDAFFCDRR